MLAARKTPPLLLDILRWVNRSDISTIKSVVSGIVQIIDDPKSNAKDLKKIIDIDPPLAARVLKLANSAYYSPRCRICDILQAVMFIGFDALKELVLSQKVCNLFQGTEAFEGYSRRLLWKHSIAVALLSKTIYRREFGEKGDVAYVAGLLHEIGIIIEDQLLQPEFRKALSASRQRRLNLFQAEKEVLGLHHSTIGGALAENWNLSPALTAAIAHHHHPETAPAEHQRLVSTLYVADQLCQQNEIGYGDAPYAPASGVHRCMKRLKLSSESLALIFPEVCASVEEMERLRLF